MCAKAVRGREGGGCCNETIWETVRKKISPRNLNTRVERVGKLGDCCKVESFS